MINLHAPVNPSPPIFTAQLYSPFHNKPAIIEIPSRSHVKLEAYIRLYFTLVRSAWIEFFQRDKRSVNSVLTTYTKIGTLEELQRYVDEFNKLSFQLRRQAYEDAIQQEQNENINNFEQFTCTRIPQRPSRYLMKNLMDVMYARAVKNPLTLNYYGAFSPEAYGESSYELIEYLLNLLMMKENDVFVDLGSGVGNIVLQVAALSRCRLCVGIEKADCPSEFAQNMAKEFKFWMAWFCKSHAKFKLFKGDFLSEEFNHYYNEATIIFANNVAFGSIIDHQLKLRFLNLRHGAVVISSKEFVPARYRYNSRTAEDIGAIMRVSFLPESSVSWTARPIRYCLQRIDKELPEGTKPEQDEYPNFKPAFEWIDIALQETFQESAFKQRTRSSSVDRCSNWLGGLILNDSNDNKLFNSTFPACRRPMREECVFCKNRKPSKRSMSISAWRDPVRNCLNDIINIREDIKAHFYPPESSFTKPCNFENQALLMSRTDLTVHEQTERLQDNCDNENDQASVFNPTANLQSSIDNSMVEPILTQAKRKRSAIRASKTKISKVVEPLLINLSSIEPAPVINNQLFDEDSCNNNNMFDDSLTKEHTIDGVDIHLVNKKNQSVQVDTPNYDIPTRKTRKRRSTATVRGNQSRRSRITAKTKLYKACRQKLNQLKNQTISAYMREIRDHYMRALCFRHGERVRSVVRSQVQREQKFQRIIEMSFDDLIKEIQHIYEIFTCVFKARFGDLLSSGLNPKCCFDMLGNGIDISVNFSALIQSIQTLRTTIVEYLTASFEEYSKGIVKEVDRLDLLRSYRSTSNRPKPQASTFNDCNEILVVDSDEEFEANAKTSIKVEDLPGPIESLNNIPENVEANLSKYIQRFLSCTHVKNSNISENDVYALTFTEYFQLMRLFNDSTEFDQHFAKLLDYDKQLLAVVLQAESISQLFGKDISQYRAIFDDNIYKNENQNLDPQNETRIKNEPIDPEFEAFDKSTNKKKEHSPRRNAMKGFKIYYDKFVNWCHTRVTDTQNLRENEARRLDYSLARSFNLNTQTKVINANFNCDSDTENVDNFGIEPLNCMTDCKNCSNNLNSESDLVASQPLKSQPSQVSITDQKSILAQNVTITSEINICKATEQNSSVPVSTTNYETIDCHHDINAHHLSVPSIVSPQQYFSNQTLPTSYPFKINSDNINDLQSSKWHQIPPLTTTLQPCFRNCNIPCACNDLIKDALCHDIRDDINMPIGNVTDVINLSHIADRMFPKRNTSDFGGDKFKPSRVNKRKKRKPVRRPILLSRKNSNQTPTRPCPQQCVRPEFSELIQRIAPLTNRLWRQPPLQQLNTGDINERSDHKYCRDQQSSFRNDLTNTFCCKTQCDEAEAATSDSRWHPISGDINETAYQDVDMELAGNHSDCQLSSLEEKCGMSRGNSRACRNVRVISSSSDGSDITLTNEYFIPNNNYLFKCESNIVPEINNDNFYVSSSGKTENNDSDESWRLSSPSSEFDECCKLVNSANCQFPNNVGQESNPDERMSSKPVITESHKDSDVYYCSEAFDTDSDDVKSDDSKDPDYVLPRSF
ncbi:hypothetical protein GJ496_011505 [Pomphorhynchus laevis]|nr:hypothetical protein GJ496_011505 [Pomphorhynchus laevis]